LYSEIEHAMRFAAEEASAEVNGNFGWLNSISPEFSPVFVRYRSPQPTNFLRVCSGPMP
jgi:hypothetical protein